MYKPSQIHHSHCHEECLSAMPDTFGVLCWNIYKKNRAEDAFVPYIKRAFSDIPDLMLLQEAAFEADSTCLIEGYTFHVAANLAYQERY